MWILDQINSKIALTGKMAAGGKPSFKLYAKGESDQICSQTGREEVTAMWKESHNAITEIINRSASTRNTRTLLKVKPLYCNHQSFG